MLVYDIIRNCDITQAIHIYLADWADEDELRKIDKTIAKIYDFWKMICELTPNPSLEDILIASKCCDENGKITIGASLYKKDDFEDSLRIIREKEFPDYSPEDPMEILDNIDICGWFPVSYDYEWSQWEDILGFTVFKENIDRNGADAVAAYIFYEMTFDGWTKDVRDARIDGIAEAICGMIQDIEEDEACGNNRQKEKTNTECTYDKKSIRLEMLRNKEMEFRELKMICMDRELRKVKGKVLCSMKT